MAWNIKEKILATLAAEQGAVSFPPGARRPIALAYPNTYHVGMSNLGLHIIYREWNQRGDTACERVFLPDRKLLEEYRRTHTPLLTLENQQPLYEFPIIAFAVSFEMDYFNLLTMLELGRVPLTAAERGEHDPIVIAGGPCATFNPEPIAPFIDAFVIGEGEEVVQQLVDSLYETADAGLERCERLRRVAEIPGVYVPRFYEPEFSDDGQQIGCKRIAPVPERVQRRWVTDLDAYAGYSAIAAPDTEFQDMVLVEISRGCGRHCRFCMAGYCFRRPRVRSLATVTEALRLGKAFRNKVGLMGAAISDYPWIDEVCKKIRAEGMTMSVASLRADSLSEVLVGALAASGHRTITLAPEAGSERMRKVINKGVEEAHLFASIEKAISAGILHVRLYIMVGLPFETDEDIEAIIGMSRRVKARMEELGSRGKLTLSVNPFIPKPFTPFQWLPMADQTVVEARLKHLRDALSGRSFEVLIEPTKEAYIQGVLARGDRRIGGVLLTAHQMGGAKSWRRAFKESGLNEDFYLYRQRKQDELFPWDILNMGFAKEYLYEELARAERLEYTPSCFNGCDRCGVCD